MIRLMQENPANQLRPGSLSTIIYRVLYIQTVVVWDFFHQQYVEQLSVFFSNLNCSIDKLSSLSWIYRIIHIFL